MTDTCVTEQTRHILESFIKDRLHLVTLKLAIVPAIGKGDIEQLVTQLVVGLVVVKHHAATQGISNSQSDGDAVMSQNILPSATR